MNASGPDSRHRGKGGPILWCLLAAALFGVSTPASKPLLGGLSALLLSGVLYLGAAIAVAPWALRGLSVLRSVDRKHLIHLCGAVVFAGVLGLVLLLTGFCHQRARELRHYRCNLGS